MRSITKYLADDGCEFPTAADCVAHEMLCAEIAELVSILPARPTGNDGFEFVDQGRGYLQHDAANFHRFRLGLLAIAKRFTEHRWIQAAMDDPTRNPRYAASLISEISRPLSIAWDRVMCTDTQLREWGQPFYTANPDQAEQQIRLN